ncbi:hypothetical protein CLV32_0485 [Pedobacter duraquae]|uniref:Uncharacterized protein n=1 Tax=Pedobacter duraquae TaxID=425511 RepID=A0A4R6IQ96_9SPHI|nr:hypothetical protein CLV32_0485 [Pedobacter duraquae]
MIHSKIKIIGFVKFSFWLMKVLIHVFLTQLAGKG